MKRKQYIITTGEYESYQIVAVVEGNIRPALSTLRKRFHEENKVIFADQDEPYVTVAMLRSESDAIKRLQGQGYQGVTLAEIFVEWIQKEHGFTVVPTNEVWIA